MVRHVDVPRKAIGGEQAARWMTAAHDWFTYAPVTTLPVQLTAYPLHAVQLASCQIYAQALLEYVIFIMWLRYRP